MRARAGLHDGRHLHDRVVVASNIPEMIVMIGHIFMSESRTVLRPMLVAGTLVDAAPAAPTHVGQHDPPAAGCCGGARGGACGGCGVGRLC